MLLTSDALSADVAYAIARGLLGIGLLDENLIVAQRCGALSGWLPAEGESACASPMLLHMEEAMNGLRAQGGELALPSMRPPVAELARVTISISWNEASRHFVVLTTPDHGGDQIDRLLASERREKLLLQQQAEAAAARLRIAATLYRDIVECAGDLVLRFGADRRVVFVNRRAAEFFGAPQDALVNRTIDELFPGRAANDPWRLDAFADQPASFEMAARNARGALVWLWWDVRFSGPDGSGEFQAVGRDVTALRRLAAEQDKAREEARAAALASQRLRIAHDLHDTLVRSIVTLILEIGVVARDAPHEATKSALRELQAQARAGLAEARTAITELRAAGREDEDPRRIVEDFADRVGARDGIEVCADIDDGTKTLPGEFAETLNRVLREALRNIELHAGARRVSVSLRREGDAARLQIVDDGIGFDPERPTPGHFGLAGMKERAALIGATLEIVSAPGKGTRLTLRAPLAAAQP